MFENKVMEYLDLHQSDGDFGVEIEMEVNKNLPSSFHTDVNKTGWVVETDGSLRGYSGRFSRNHDTSSSIKGTHLKPQNSPSVSTKSSGNSISSANIPT